MKKVFFLLLLICYSLSVSGQQQYTINGKPYELKTAVEGHLDLLWTIIDKHYHYFVKTDDGSISELLNTKGETNNYQEEYKAQLKVLTSSTKLSTEDLKFTLQSLKQFFKTYNTSIGHSAYIEDRSPLKPRLSLYGGLTNHPFVANPNNTTAPFFAAELEVISLNDKSRHAGFFNIEHALDNDNFKYSATQLGLGYRYRFIKNTAFNMYGNLLFASYTFSKNTIALTNTTDEIVKNSAFKIPFIFGLGADLKISDRSFITLSYNELFALFIENSNNFPVDFAVGYRLNL